METATIILTTTDPGAVTLCAGGVFAVSEVCPCPMGVVLLVEVAP